MKIEGSDVKIESPNIESAGNAASKIELLTKITKRDCRVFQDGIFITRKAKQK